MAESPSKVVPVLVAALICDAAVPDRGTGKKSLIGIFDRLWASQFPTIRPVSLYLKITDASGFYRLKVRFVQVEGDRVLAEGGGEITIPDRKASFDFLMDFPPLVFPEKGRYLFEIFMNEVRIGGAFMDAVPATELQGG